MNPYALGRVKRTELGFCPDPNTVGRCGREETFAVVAHDKMRREDTGYIGSLIENLSETIMLYMTTPERGQHSMSRSNLKSFEEHTLFILNPHILGRAASSKG
jgi:hypothetical protein